MIDPLIRPNFPLFVYVDAFFIHCTINSDFVVRFFGGRLQRKLFNNFELERKVYPMTEEQNVSSWIQDNLRIIISIGIVILLVFAIYSYSKRNARTDVVVDDSTAEETAMTSTEKDEVSEIIDEITDDAVTTDVDEVPPVDQIGKGDDNSQEVVTTDIEEVTDEVTEDVTEEEPVVTKPTADIEDGQQTKEEIVRDVIESQMQENTGVITVTAVYGDSMTTMARKATTEYITKNNITDLTKAHRIYIEDYLRKHQTYRRLHPDTSMEFSHAQINEAIQNAQNLTEAELKNLDRYAQNVSSF
jgi:hypothetical protein